MHFSVYFSAVSATMIENDENVHSDYFCNCGGDAGHR